MSTTLSQGPQTNEVVVDEHWIHTIAGVMGNVLEWYVFSF